MKKDHLSKTSLNRSSRSLMDALKQYLAYFRRPYQIQLLDFRPCRTLMFPWPRWKTASAGSSGLSELPTTMMKKWENLSHLHHPNTFQQIEVFLFNFFLFFGINSCRNVGWKWNDSCSTFSILTIFSHLCHSRHFFFFFFFWLPGTLSMAKQFFFYSYQYEDRKFLFIL